VERELKRIGIMTTPGVAEFHNLGEKCRPAAADLAARARYFGSLRQF
jgi:hypothetical protein